MNKAAADPRGRFQLGAREQNTAIAGYRDHRLPRTAKVGSHCPGDRHAQAGVDVADQFGGGQKRLILIGGHPIHHHQRAGIAGVPQAGVELNRIEAHGDYTVGRVEQVITRLLAEQAQASGELIWSHPGARTLKGGAIGQAAPAHAALQRFRHGGL
jgi:hypothetical protein